MPVSAKLQLFQWYLETPQKVPRTRNEPINQHKLSTNYHKILVSPAPSPFLLHKVLIAESMLVRLTLYLSWWPLSKWWEIQNDTVAPRTEMESNSSNGDTHFSVDYLKRDFLSFTAESDRKWREISLMEHRQQNKLYRVSNPYSVYNEMNTFLFDVLWGGKLACNVIALHK